MMEKERDSQIYLILLVGSTNMLWTCWQLKKTSTVSNQSKTIKILKITYGNFCIFKIFLGGSHMSGGNTLQLKGLGYEAMAGTYKCIVVSIGGQNSGTGTLQVYCKYCEEL